MTIFAASEHAANNILWPKLSKVLPDYPDIKVEITVDYALTDIVAQRYDAGVRLGEQVAKDMIAVPIGPSLRIAVVGSPQYFKNRSIPMTPGDLAAHNCINLRLPTHGSLLQWDFEKDGHELKAPGRRAMDIQQQRADPAGGGGWMRFGVSAGRYGRQRAG